LRLYWWKDVPNFGDEITRLLVEHICGVTPEWADFANADLVGAGSVIEHIPAGWSGTVLGSGKISALMSQRLSFAHILALRGPLTAQFLGIRARDIALGDPGLLAYTLVGAPVPAKEFDVGIVPHWLDTSLPHDPRFFSDKWTTEVIYPTDDAIDVITRIAKCDKIVTSSLHGLVVADSFDIPRRIEKSKVLSNVTEGNYFKFKDYLASIDMELEFGKIQSPRYYTVEDRQQDLYDLFEGLKL
jgi:pyruvyltransferase